MFNISRESAHRAEVPRQAVTATVVSPRNRLTPLVPQSSVARATSAPSLSRSELADFLKGPTRPVRTAEPAWFTHDPPVGRGQAFITLWSPKRKALQGALAKMHSELQSPISPALADDFRTALFTPDATQKEKEDALRLASRPQQQFLQCTATFLSACQDWLRDEGGDLPAEAKTMVDRLRTFLQCCREPDSAADSYRLAQRQFYKKIRALGGDRGGASMKIPENVQAFLAAAGARGTERVRENCELLKSINTSMTEIERVLPMRAPATRVDHLSASGAKEASTPKNHSHHNASSLPGEHHVPRVALSWQTKVKLWVAQALATSARILRSCWRALTLAWLR